MESANDNNDNVERIGNPSVVRSDAEKAIIEALCRIAVCVRNVALYGKHHSVVSDSAEAVRSVLAGGLQTLQSATVIVNGDYLVLDNYPIEDKTGCLAVLARMLSERGAGEITLTSEASAEEILDFAEALNIDPMELLLHGGIVNELESRGVTNLAVRSASKLSEAREGRDPADIYEEALLLIEEAMRAVKAGLKIPVPEIRAVVADSLKWISEDESVLLALAGIRSYDRYLSEHSVNVCILSMVLGRELGLEPQASIELGLAAMLHDVGKVFVPSDIVRKPDRLREDEWQQIRKHPIEGARVLAGIEDIPALASAVAFEHHMRCDGSGYPAVSGKSAPHLLSRLVAIVDTYDALTTDRPYRQRWTAKQALGYMLYDAPRQYDRQLLAKFATRVGLYPIGTIVRIKRGDLAVVVGGSSADPDNPKLKIVPSSKSLSADVEIIDLSVTHSPEFQIESVAQPVEVLLPLTESLLAA